jgi:hypothetical protein
MNLRGRFNSLRPPYCFCSDPKERRDVNSTTAVVPTRMWLQCGPAYQAHYHRPHSQRSTSTRKKPYAKLH